MLESREASGRLLSRRVVDRWMREAAKIEKSRKRGLVLFQSFKVLDPFKVLNLNPTQSIGRETFRRLLPRCRVDRKRLKGNSSFKRWLYDDKFYEISLV